MGHHRQPGSSRHGCLGAPESVARLTIPGAGFRRLRSRGLSSIDLGTEATIRNPAAGHLMKIAKNEFGQNVFPASLAEPDS